MSRPDPNIETPYPDVDPQPNFPELEKQILDFWRAEAIFSAPSRSAPKVPAARMNSSSMTAPPSPTGFPTTGT